jgi:hypothetical protein
MMMNVVGERTTVGKNRKRPRKDDLKDNTAQPVRRSTRLLWKDKSKKQKEEKGDSSESVVHHPSVTVKKEENKRHFITLMEEEEMEVEKEEEEKKVRKRYTNCSRLYSSNGCLRPDPDAPMSESSFSMDSDTSSDSSTNKRELAYYRKLREALEAPGAYPVYEHVNAEERIIRVEREEREESEKLRMIEYYRSEIAKIKRDKMVPAPSSNSSLSSSSSCDGEESPIPNQAEFLKGMARHQAIAKAQAKSAIVKYPLRNEEDSDDDSSESDEIKKSEKENSELDSSFSSLDSDESSNGAMEVDDDEDSVTYTMKKTFKNIPVRLTYQPSDEEKLCGEAAYPHTGYRCSKQTGNYTSSELNLGLQLWDRW